MCLYIKDNGCRAGGYTCRSRSRCGRAHRCGPHGRNRGRFRNDGALCIYRASEFESGLLNLLPIPLLDGGLLILTLIEGISGKELPERALYYIQAVGITIIGFIFLFAMFNDVMSLMK